MCENVILEQTRQFLLRKGIDWHFVDSNCKHSNYAVCILESSKGKDGDNVKHVIEAVMTSVCQAKQKDNLPSVNCVLTSVAVYSNQIYFNPIHSRFCWKDLVTIAQLILDYGIWA